MEWNESESYYDSVEKKQKSRTVHYRSEQNFFHNEYNLVSGGDNFTLPAGRHTYPFSFVLPHQLPSAFEGKHGHIRYVIKATVDRPWKFDYEAKVMIPIVAQLDLNFIPGVRVCSGLDQN